MEEIVAGVDNVIIGVVKVGVTLSLSTLMEVNTLAVFAFAVVEVVEERICEVVIGFG